MRLGVLSLGVLGPITGWDDAGQPLALRGPRHRAVLARLLVARGRVVPRDLLVDDLWEDPPDDATAALQTFVSDLRRVLEPDRAPRAPARTLITAGGGYALRDVEVDADRFTARTAALDGAPAERRVHQLQEALTWWRGPAYAEFVRLPWARPEQARLSELRLLAVEQLAAARLELGRPEQVVGELEAHVTDHPWREPGWRLLALALYRSGRPNEAADALRRARTRLADDLGLDPGPDLVRLETDVLQRAGHLDRESDPAERVLADVTASYARTVARPAARLNSAVDLLRGMAVTGGAGLTQVRAQRLSTVRAAQDLGDPVLTARVIGAYDVPAIWTRSDDPDQAAQLTAAAEHTLAGLPPHAAAVLRARLLATVGIESRGLPGPRGREAALGSERLARGSLDPALLAFCLNAVFLQSFHRTGLAADRDAIGTELVELASRHGLTGFEILGRLVRLQSRAALGDVTGADEHAQAADELARRHDTPLVGVFTGWYRALRLALTGRSGGEAEAAYREAATLLPGSGMPGVADGLLALALTADAVRQGRPVPPDALDAGPFSPWTRPMALLAAGDRAAATAALDAVPVAPPDHLLEVRWVLLARAAHDLERPDLLATAQQALAPAVGQHSAGSGLLTAGPIDAVLEL